MPTLLQLKAFVAVVDQGGFTAASRRLGLSQPAVSRAVATLEKELGLRLLVRSRDGLSLTEAGSLALTHAREAARHLSLMHTEIAALAGEITGTLSLASLPSVTGTLVAPQLQTFTERHPAVTMRLLEGSEQEVRDWLDQGAAEAGVVSLPVKGLAVAVLGEQDMVAAVPADNRLADWTEVNYAELAKDERFGTPAARTRNYAELRAILAEAFATRPRDEWIEILTTREVPAAPVLDVSEVQADRQVVHRGTFARSIHPAMGEVVAIKSPITLDGERRDQFTPPPELGADAAAISAEFGLG